MAMANDYYTYRVLWSNGDKEYVGLCAEFPSLSWLAETQEEAFLGIRDVVEEVVSDMQANDEPIPEPLAMRLYSGHIMVRVPPEVHQTLAIQAAESNISLNRLVNARLTTP
jgi:predicted HicB family RNase H-like nuclease